MRWAIVAVALTLITLITAGVFGNLAVTQEHERTTRDRVAACAKAASDDSAEFVTCIKALG